MWHPESLVKQRIYWRLFVNMILVMDWRYECKEDQTQLSRPQIVPAVAARQLHRVRVQGARIVRYRSLGVRAARGRPARTGPPARCVSVARGAPGRARVPRGRTARAVSVTAIAATTPGARGWRGRRSRLSHS